MSFSEDDTLFCEGQGVPLIALYVDSFESSWLELILANNFCNLAE